jgi:hypothetical protein
MISSGFDAKKQNTRTDSEDNSNKLPATNMPTSQANGKRF